MHDVTEMKYPLDYFYLIIVLVYLKYRPITYLQPINPPLWNVTYLYEI